MNQIASPPSAGPAKATIVLSTREIFARCAFTAAQDSSCSTTEKLALDDIPPPRHPAGVIGDYELLEIVAQGGMGVVYKARQCRLNRVVALKLLLGGNHAGPDFKRRFQQEAETVAKLKHPNIVPIYEIGEHEQQPYFSMEYVAGKDFAQLVKTQPLPAKTAAQYLVIIAEAIAYAHQQGVLHRDLKPSNILLGLDDRPRVTDFGLARQLDADSSLTASGTMLGTPGYMPPEQASTKRGQVGSTSDVYSLGAVLYHLLTGRPPFTGGTVADVLQEVLHQDPAPVRRLNPKVPADLETICLKCLRKAAPERYLSAQLLADDLSRFLRNEPIQAREPMMHERIAKWCLRQPVAAGLLTTLVLGAGVAGWRLNHLSAESRLARQDASQQSILGQQAWQRAERAQAKSDHWFNLAQQTAHETRLAQKAADTARQNGISPNNHLTMPTASQPPRAEIVTVTYPPAAPPATAPLSFPQLSPSDNQPRQVYSEASWDGLLPRFGDGASNYLASNSHKMLPLPKPKEFARSLKQEIAALRELHLPPPRHGGTEAFHHKGGTWGTSSPDISLPSSLASSITQFVGPSSAELVLKPAPAATPATAAEPHGWGRVKWIHENQAWFSLGTKDGLALGDKVRIYLPRVTNDLPRGPQTNFILVAEITISILRAEESMGANTVPLMAGWPALAPHAKLK
jgi:serine/threonine protein kinase